MEKNKVKEKNIEKIKEFINMLEKEYPHAIFENKDAEYINNFLTNCVWQESVEIDGIAYQGATFSICTDIQMDKAIQKKSDNGNLLEYVPCTNIMVMRINNQINLIKKNICHVSSVPFAIDRYEDIVLSIEKIG